MPKVKVFDLLKEVEYNRKSLIKHCNENGINVSPNASLSTAVGFNNTINKDFSSVKKKVIWIDIDGSTLYETEVDYGSSVSHPNIIPNYDPEYLEFDYWQTNADLDNITEDSVIGPIYKVKPDSDGKKWSYLFCNFTDETKLSPTLDIDFTNKNTTLYIDWGDGSEIEAIQTTITTGADTLYVRPNHTYASIGKYIIKFWADDKIYNHAYNSGAILMSKNSIYYNQFIEKAYLSDNWKEVTNCAFENAYTLQAVAISHGTELGIHSGGGKIFSGCRTIKAIILPESFKYVLGNYVTVDSMFRNNYNLNYAIISNASSNGVLNDYSFNGCYNLSIFNMPKNISHIYEYSFQSCYILNYLNLSNITEIQRDCFRYCYNLHSIELGPNIKTIGNSCFSHLYNTKILVIPNSIESIGSSCFADSYNLKELILFTDFNFSFSTPSYALLDENLIQIGYWLKDNSESDTKNTFTFSAYGTKNRLQNLFLDKITGLQTTENNENAISLLEYMQNKNWTITAN